MFIYYFSFIFFSLVPSLLWLIFFLMEDKNPEPGRKIIKAFLWGMIISIPVLIFTLPIKKILDLTNLSDIAVKIIMVALVAAFLEELFKFLALRYSILKSSDCDEPVDLMVYAITIGLGFAALENFFFLTPLAPQDMMAMDSFLRFVSGTFLHALVGGIMGYFVALSILYSKKRTYLITTGVFLAMLLHAGYNFSIIYTMVWSESIIFAPTILITLFIAVLLCFSRLKKMASICQT